MAAQAMDWTVSGMDFADALHLAASKGCETFLTLDQSFARAAARADGPPVTAP